MLARFADALYWAGRYVERIDAVARLVEVEAARAAELPEARCRWLLAATSSAEAYAATWADGVVTAPRVLRFLTQDRANPSGIRHGLRLARDNARVVRERLTPPMADTIDGLWQRAEPHLDGDGADAMVPFCRVVCDEVARFHGLAASSMPRGEDHAFLRLGTFVERADMTARILAAGARALAAETGGAAAEDDAWAALPASVGAADAHRRLHHDDGSPGAVADLVCLDPRCPRSLRFAVARIARALLMIDGGRPLPATARIVDVLRDAVSARPRRALVGERLEVLLAHVVARLAELHRALEAVYFQPTDAPACGRPQ